ncbi:TFIIB-type zinc ribbon-containing protein [Magnetospirillum sp. ME-1]|uniref:TFIIB-type zinc ribbon-containing protein n=1 Tax=Magnetospirillum sp. ME-1 TaxID=1639348 RepID=UPI000A18FD20|nr:zf-TFIIB domain-containing protein [Magnetospirillum sp. ME-1]
MPLLVCPNCNVGMSNIQRSGVEIDICPQCRGVWLDRGELEKLLEPVREYVSDEASVHPARQAGFASGGALSAWGHAASRPAADQWGRPQADGDHHREHGYDVKHGHGEHHGPHRKTGMRGLLDIFD